MEYLHQIESSGLLGEDPTSHPAWDPEDPPSILQIYDQRIYPDCTTRTFQHLDYLYKPLGQAIREMNLALGIPYADYCTLIRSTQACDACLNHFSPDGYAHHRRDGLCSNHPDLAPIPEGEPFTGEIRLRSFADDTSPSFRGETLNSSVGSALLEWNSRLGIPADVWMMASTAVVHCTSCDLLRSFPAHIIHLDNELCNDPGQKLIVRT
ncbi:hypothetical protein B0H16DRAFT_1509383 [Mycena metata]|uniref:Uncharacterized protein n=1 Tax=Mycena metata TaxID=1033252 RepID=A0AAD7HHL5_9AGAR|nr:hypothetical protein B0H16DRAFT_1605327 [Mycena metata]KAJ7775052.1 hypothetical protein B0H16DRAFT_1509383 [Mycena metata]